MSKNDDLVRRLRPCPFCGNDGSGPIEEALQIFHSEPCDYDDRHTWSVQCDRCTATMGYSDSEDEAIDAWNRRHPDARAEAAEASNKALREIVPNLDHVISWLENGCDRQAAAQELRIYQSRDRALLSETGGE